MVNSKNVSVKLWIYDIKTIPCAFCDRLSGSEIKSCTSENLLPRILTWFFVTYARILTPHKMRDFVPSVFFGFFNLPKHDFRQTAGCQKESEESQQFYAKQPKIISLSSDSGHISSKWKQWCCTQAANLKLCKFCEFWYGFDQISWT